MWDISTGHMLSISSGRSTYNAWSNRIIRNIQGINKKSKDKQQKK